MFFMPKHSQTRGRKPIENNVIVWGDIFKQSCAFYSVLFGVDWGKWQFIVRTFWNAESYGRVGTGQACLYGSSESVTKEKWLASSVQLSQSCPLSLYLRATYARRRLTGFARWVMCTPPSPLISVDPRPQCPSPASGSFAPWPKASRDIVNSIVVGRRENEIKRPETSMLLAWANTMSIVVVDVREAPMSPEGWRARPSNYSERVVNA